MPKISVIMSVYNNANALETAVNSILSQTFQDFEFIIVDDASTDNSLNILKALAERNNRISIIQNQKNEGLAASLNKALEQAKGEYIARQDAHASSRPGRFEAQAQFLDAHPEVAVLGSATNSVTPPTGDASIKLALAHKNVMVHGSIMMRTKTLKAIGGYNPEYRYVQDYELWRRLAASGAIFANLPQPLYDFKKTVKPTASENAKRLLYLMNAKEKNKTILPLSRLPLLRKLEFLRYQTRYFLKRFLHI